MKVPAFTRSRIERLCADALRHAGVAGVLFSVIALVVFSRLLSDIQAAADRRITQLDRALAASMLTHCYV